MPIHHSPTRTGLGQIANNLHRAYIRNSHYWHFIRRFASCCVKLKVGDSVLILAGKDRGKKGKVIKVLPKENQLVVEGINLRKKHVKPRKQGEKGQIVEVPMSFDVSNAKLICPKCKKAVRIEYKITDKNKFRVCKKCKQEI